MILDRLEQAERYLVLHSRFAKAFGFLSDGKLAEMPEGRHEIDGDKLFAIIDRAEGRTREDANLEVHDKYIDIQLVLAGSDTMGWRSRSTCGNPIDEYDPDRDIMFYSDEPAAWIPVGPQTFTIFFPDDAHAPLVGKGDIHKVVMKIQVE